jgi:hypothetical protein
MTVVAFVMMVVAFVMTVVASVVMVVTSVVMVVASVMMVVALHVDPAGPKWRGKCQHGGLGAKLPVDKYNPLLSPHCHTLLHYHYTITYLSLISQAEQHMKKRITTCYEYD